MMLHTACASKARRCLAMLLLSTAALLPPGTATARPPADRRSAFIGYHEQQPQECRDRLPAECEVRASEAACLSDPFTMRAMCSQSCGTGACKSQQLRGRQRLKRRGRATPHGTWTYAKAFRRTVARNHYTEVDLMSSHDVNSTLLLSSLGTGTYLGNADAATDEAVVCAILYSVMHGWNVIDTASNYRAGRAESAVGQALDVLLVGDRAKDFAQPAGTTSRTPSDTRPHLGDTNSAAGPWGDEGGMGSMGSSKDKETSKGTDGTGRDAFEAHAVLRARRMGIASEQAVMAPDVTRDMLFVSTKAGFVSEEERRGLMERAKVKGEDFVGGHCMHPVCLRASLLQSLDRMGLESVDLLYVHNPAELQLASRGRAAFMASLKAAFAELEALRQEGLLGVYGLATWDCFRVPPNSPQHLSLADVVALAEEVGGLKHGFRAIQLPINARMHEAWSQPSQHIRDATGVQALTFMEAAAKLGIAVFASGPLLEGELLKAPSTQLDGIPSLTTLPSTAAKLLQLARSTPGLTSALVGHKQREHVEANHEVSLEPRLAPKRFRLVHEEVANMLGLNKAPKVQQ